MPPLTSTQLSLLRSERHRSFHYLVPCLSGVLFAARVNDVAIAVGARVITYDTPTGDYTHILGGETLDVGSSAGAHDLGKARIISATATQLTISENSDIAWADNLYLTVQNEYLIWPKRHRIDNTGTKLVDYNIAYTDQTDKWPPVAMMGDPCAQFFIAGVTPDAAVYFDGSQSYAMAPSATITGYSWAFPGGSPATSSAQIPGIVTWNAVGYYWCSLTVTDSNGKTATTRRLIAVVDPTSINVFNDFQIESCEVSIDGVLKAQFKVFGTATLSTFKERSAVFWVRDDRYGDTHASVGFPPGREHVSLFGYIDERSLRKDPYTNEITFTLLNAAGVMQNASTYPVWCQDKTTPAVWTDAKKLTIRRSLFYLLKFHSTVFEVADVELPNDTTPTRKADFPENNLWVQYDNFARVARGERTGVTKTGRLITRPDPQLLPTAQRNALAVICQLQSKDWVTEVDWNETDWPNVSFLDLWGITYDANPAHESNPVHSMAPGNPYKDYGSQEQQQYMQLNGQTDGNAYAGFLLGQKNWRYAPTVKITLGGNWWNCIDPAWQEYIKAPTGGFPTKEDATQLANARLIVRTIRMAQQWGTGAFNTEIECEVETVAEQGVTGPIPVDVSEPPAGCSPGDTYDPDTAACITPAAPPCSLSSLGIGFTTVPAPVLGVVEGPAPFSVDFVNASTNADGYLWDFGDGSSSTSTNPTHVFTKAGTYIVKLTAYNACQSDSITATIRVDYEVDFTFTSPVNVGNTVTFTKTVSGDTVIEYVWNYGDGYGLDDISGVNPTHIYNYPGTRNVKLTVTFEGGTKVSRTHPIVVLPVGAGTGTLGGMDVWILYGDGMIGHLTSLTPGAEVFTQLNEWKTAFGGGGITAYALSPAASTRVMLLSFGATTFRFNKSSDNAVSWVQNDTTLADFPGLVDIDRNNPDHAWAITDVDGSNIVHGWYTTNGGVNWTKITLWTNPADEGNLWLGVALGGNFAYAMVVENATTNPKVHFMKVLSDGSFTTETFNMTGAWNFPASSSLQPNGGYIDPTNADRVFLVASNIGSGSLAYTLFTLDWFAGTLSSQALPVLDTAFDVAKTVIVTVMGTVLVFVEGTTTYVMRSTDHGATWSTINLSVAYGNNLALRFAQATEVGGTPNTTPGVVVVAMTLDGTDGGRFLFSTDDGATWSRSPVIGYTSSNLQSSGGVRSRT